MSGTTAKRSQSSSSIMELTSSSSTATPRSSGGSRKRAGHKKSFNEGRDTNRREVDAIRNPTHLFQKINSGDWEGALNALYDRPMDASVWVSRQSSGEAEISWKYLPLHLICLQRRPPLNLLQQLVQVYPNAASMPTPHDGNLAMHYACDSGCDSPKILYGVLAALLDAYPQSLESKNFKGKTPLLLCSAKTRQVLMSVLRARKQTATGKKNKSEHRNDESEVSGREHLFYKRVHRHPPPLNAHLLPPLVDEDDSESEEEEQYDEKDSAFRAKFNITGNRAKSNGNISGSSILMDPSHGVKGDFHRQIEAFASQSKSQQEMIAKLNERLLQLTSNHHDEDIVSEDAKLLCQRILAKAEADSVKFRTQIQQLQADNDQLKQYSAAQEESILKTLVNVRDVLLVKGEKMKLTLFSEGVGSSVQSTDAQSTSTKCSSLSSKILEALEALFSHVEMNDDKMRCQLKSMEEKLTSLEVQHKSAQSVNQHLRLEKEVLTKKQRDLERNINELKDEKKAVEESLADVKEKNLTLIVTNKSLQEQITTLRVAENVDSGCISREHIPFDKVNNVVGQTEQGVNSHQKYLLMERHNIEENEAKIASLMNEMESLREKNRSLKDTILMNNEKYLNKVQELGEKYSELEKVNSDLRERISKSSTSGRSRSSLKVSLEGEDKLLYEV